MTDKNNPPKYTPMSNDEHGTREARDKYEKWYYETYVKHCYANNRAGCDKCVPYEETMNGRYEGYEEAQKNKQKSQSGPKTPQIEWDYSLKAYVDVANGKLVK